ncbi:hypothetical protein [Bdellovibrio sp. HCB337]|uniref:hypothetical protein n=1 Tax=Bdellovibrio sp. HCB337 TaxID=3394358 RepID=UPI0039A71547
MKTLILAALLLPGVSFAFTPTCQLNSETVVLEDITKPGLDLAAYRYTGTTAQGTFVSILLVDGAYDVYAKNGSYSVSQSRVEALNISLNVNGEALTIVCPN